MPESRRRIEVAAAVLQREDGSFLLAQRPADKVYAGYWEFPGGKIEHGETAPDALARELHEELGVQVTRYYPWITRDYDYEHAAVRLRFYRVTGWSGALHGREGQRFAWQRTNALTVSPVLPANGPILRAIALPTFYGISNAGQVGTHTFLRNFKLALQAGLRLVQLREKTLAPGELAQLITEALALARPYGASVLLNGDESVAATFGMDGVHLSAARLMRLDSRPNVSFVGASCHDARELTRAAELGLDFVLLGPLQETPTHPGGGTLGWNHFEALVADYPLPVYAIGGLTKGDLQAAWQAGAHGVAAIRGAWSEL
ncbi:MAG: mutator MutT protein [Betaproteobacteria bacterium]|jgi:8-oxo-dGTP diphosphatase|nr:mutator MutT protein [Betaproteobacteria bacterium]MEA3154057.1 8-oxo-dGTP diphosphatase [Betaproteobacteria bacterium]